MVEFECRSRAAVARLLMSAGLVLAMAACGGGGDESAAVPDPETPPPSSGEFVTSQHTEAQIARFENLRYAVRPNTLGLQYTSSDTRLDELGSSELSLKMDVYVPPGASSTVRKPLVIWIHGGGFYAGSKSDTADEAMSYARAGYVSATLNYRLSTGAQLDPNVRLATIQEATEDVMNAVRFLKVNAATYGIDTTRMVTIGASAGGALSLFNAIDPDTLWSAVSDYSGTSSRVSAAVSTGATLVGNDGGAASVLNFAASDSPVLLLHADPTDSETGFTWSGNVLPTQKLINDSGNVCTTVAQPDGSHTVDLSLGGAYWTNYLLPFLWARLKLSGV
ncbi:carboxylesterase family protein [Ideonella sp.]|uniref:carboxylesterase family protein n=1 Tax=Ideonella sp. TaxID=1929293 RepID=UPI003BB62C3E